MKTEGIETKGVDMLSNCLTVQQLRTGGSPMDHQDASMGRCSVVPPTDLYSKYRKAVIGRKGCG